MFTVTEPSTTMTCPECCISCKKFGKHRNGLRRFRCTKCRKTYTEAHEAPFTTGMLLQESRGLMAIQLLLEGNSIRSTERITGIHRDTIVKVLLIAGEHCEALLAEKIRNVPCHDVQCDEMWGFVYKKEGHKTPEEAHNDKIGDAYTWVAIERHTKLVLAFEFGRRTAECAMSFMAKVRNATSSDQRFQLTTDGLNSYIAAVDEFLMDRCDYAQLVKVYANLEQNERRYSPAECTGAVPVPVSGNPDPARICTSHVERQNLTMRMQIRRLTRLTNAFSKKRESLRAAVALHFAYYNFCRIHGSLRVTPAMAAGITNHVWTLRELL